LNHTRVFRLAHLELIPLPLVRSRPGAENAAPDDLWWRG